MEAATQTFIQIMFFYFIIAFLIMPFISYYRNNESLAAAGDGFVIGSLVSIILWLSFGRYLI